MLKINFLKKDLNENGVIEFTMATKYELLTMTQSMNNDAISKQNTIIENKRGKHSVDDIEYAKKKKEKLEAENKQIDETKEKIQPVYDKVIELMTRQNDKGYSNDSDVVKTVLRVIACAENKRLYKYAIIPAFENEDLYNCLQAIHVNNTVTEQGYSTNSKDRIALYKNAQKELDDIMRDTFSLPVETHYTESLRVKLNAQDRKCIHDCYVKGFTNDITKDIDTGVVTFNSRIYNTAIKATKKGIDYSGMATDLAKLVMSKYC